MKKYITKLSVILLASIIMWCIVPVGVNAAEEKSHCYPTEEQIQQYKKDGTWERRLEYVKKLNHHESSENLLRNAVKRNNRSDTVTAGDSLPEVWKGMQVTGDAKILLVRVEFADIKFENAKSYSEEQFYNMVMGNKETGTFPYESLNAYYKRSSYGKLNIVTDQVYNCTLSKNRDEYEWEDLGEQDLIKEVMESLDASVDFNDYDANKDGLLDAICINFAGDNTGWGSTWWSHKYDFLDSNIKFDGVTPSGYVFLETESGADSSGTQTMIHETGHLLGLPDYYSQNDEGIGTTDMMNNNQGDHNGFSKWLLGWIEEDNILRITESSGNTEVKLAPLSSDNPGNNKLIAVIAPADTSIYSEYFVVQYDEYMGNQSFGEIEKPAYRVFHVDAELSYDGDNFRNDNVYVYDRHLIQAVPIVEGQYDTKRYYYSEGDSLTPDTNRSSNFYGGSILGFTGIELTDFKTGETPSFNVSFREKETVVGNLEFEVVGETPLNMVELTLLSNKPLINAWSDEQAYLEDNDGNKHYVELSFEDGSQQLQISYISIADSLKPETEYTLVIPAGMFHIDADVYSDECRVTVTTGKFPEIKADYTYGAEMSSDIFNLNDTQAGFVQITDCVKDEWIANLQMFEDTDALKSRNFRIPVPDSYTEIMDIKSVVCYDGTIAVQIKSAEPENYNAVTSLYKIDERGSVLAGPFRVPNGLNIFAAGNGVKGVLENSGALGAPDLEKGLQLEIYTADFENDPTSCYLNVNRYMSNVYPLDENSYIIIETSEYEVTAGIYNNKDKLIESLDLSDHIKGDVCAAVKSEDNLVIAYRTYSANYDAVISVVEFDMNENSVETHEITTFKDYRDMDGWKFEKTKWGYSLNNYTADQPYVICFLDNGFNLISGMQVPDTFSSATHLGSRCIVKWYDITSWGNRIAITAEIADTDTDTEIIPEPDEPADDGEDTVKPDEPADVVIDDIAESDSLDEEGEDSSESDAPSDDVAGNTAPKTGDDSGLLLLFIVMIISGGIIVACFNRSRKTV